MKPVARTPIDTTTGICDMGLPCCPHGRHGNNTTASPDVVVNGYTVHRLGDTGSTNCPHGGVFTSVEGSPTVIVNNKPVVRVGDTTICGSCGQSGVHDSGSDDVLIGG